MTSILVDNVTLRYPIRRKFSLAKRGKRLDGVENKNAVGGRVTAGNTRGHIDALRGVSFSLEGGDRLALVGHNGAGKSTLLKVLAGIFPPTGGRLMVEGRVDALFSARIGFRRFATGRRNIVLRGLINGWSPKEIDRRMEEIIEFSELGDFIDVPMSAYSSGMGARLAFAMATSFQPEILLMDEWMGAGDKNFKKKSQERMDMLAANAGIIVLATHSMSLVERICNKVLVLERGQVRAFLPVEEYLAAESGDGTDSDGSDDYAEADGADYD